METKSHLKILDVLAQQIISQEMTIEYKNYEIRKLQETIETLESKLKEPLKVS